MSCRARGAKPRGESICLRRARFEREDQRMAQVECFTFGVALARETLGGKRIKARQRGAVTAPMGREEACLEIPCGIDAHGMAAPGPPTPAMPSATQR